MPTFMPSLRICSYFSRSCTETQLNVQRGIVLVTLFLALSRPLGIPSPLLMCCGLVARLINRTEMTVRIEVMAAYFPEDTAEESNNVYSLIFMAHLGQFLPGERL